MLKVTVELWPGGREDGRRVLATADIARIRSGAHADYDVMLNEEVLGEVDSGTLHEYPRYAASVWDLVARGVAAALSGREELPTRPQSPRVPVHWSGDVPYVRMREIPEPAQALFRRNMHSSTLPVIEGESEPMGCAYAWDLEAFLAGHR
ncbi:MAG: hypothetical protein QM625_10270 [Ralstonia sp.]|jgi:hypothetical protein|uniref:Uncharacterized protein n=2 Tax=Ralstonia pickettii TaxID=329 RepID=A0ABN9I5A6_RALPI|nr:hypothetical protein [Ralstonia sp.]MBA9847562.1 hypothetical protein [Ralstonia pickettii]MBA4232256.1 hypothetical protein [Ralstonia sp.]MBA4236685.1 hypothetical protein [Ralstonia sp.]MBA4403301.1 hypothetical protein [Ralstonia sp.]MBA9852973.1 hypothetical protein [Ralstonia pickettii]